MKRFYITTAMLACSMAFAGGFRVSLQGVKQLAQAHTSAHAEDASVAFFNPAGMSFIPEDLSVVAGGFGVQSKITIQDPSTLSSYQTDNPLGTPAYFAIAYKPTENISLGFSATTPYGNTIQYDDNWYGKEFVQKIELRAIYLQPAISFKLAPWTSVGLSYIYAQGTVDWDKAVTGFNGTVNLKDKKAKGHGFGLGFYFRPIDDLDVSVAYRSPVDMKANNGTVSFDVSPSLFNAIGVDGNGQDKFKATLPLVDEFTLGATYKITPKWSISGDFNYYGWDEYSSLTLDFENAQIGNQADNTILDTPKNFKNSSTWRIGTEYWINEKVAGRLGYYFDQSPYSDENFTPETPSFDYNVITGGFGFKFNKGFGLDLAGGYAFPKARTFNNTNIGFSGQAKASVFYFGLGLAYNPF